MISPSTRVKPMSLTASSELADSAFVHLDVVDDVARLLALAGERELHESYVPSVIGAIATANAQPMEVHYV